MYVRDVSFIEEGRKEMIDYIRSLGLNVSNSLPVGWVFDDFGGGTFPPWFKNVTEHRDRVTGKDNCPRPCATGVFNSTTKMWGCPMSIVERLLGSHLHFKIWNEEHEILSLKKQHGNNGRTEKSRVYFHRTKYYTPDESGI